jgi:hypothetical protein
MNKHWPHSPVIVAKSKTLEGMCLMLKQRRWLIAAIEASKTTNMTLPWQRGEKMRPASLRHIQLHVAPRPKAIAAR